MRFLVLSLLALCFGGIEAQDLWENDRVYLASPPRAGNHWVRHLIEEATGIATSCVYCDPEKNKKHQHLAEPFAWGGYCANHGYSGDCRYPEVGTTVVIKTHYPYHPEFPFDNQPHRLTICLVRHPIDSLYSDFVYLGFNEPKIGKSYLPWLAGKWMNFIDYWEKMAEKEPVLFIRYEDLLEKPEVYLRMVLDHVGYSYTPEDIARAIAKHPPVGGMLKHLACYDTEDRLFLIETLGERLSKWHYEI